MSKLSKIMLTVISSFMFFTLGFGFATLTDDLLVKGTVEFKLPPIYIVSAEWISGETQQSQPSFFANSMSSSVKLSSSKSSYAVAKVVIKNSTSNTYGYSSTNALSGDVTYDNFNITYSLYTDATCKTKLLRRTELYPRTTNEGANGLTFYIKFSYVSNYTPKSGGETLNSFLQYIFLTPVNDIPEETAPVTVEGVVEKLDEIINDNIVDPSTGKTDFETLIERIKNPVVNSTRADNTSNGDTYIGSVSGSSDHDTGFLETLFEGNLNMVIDGKKTDVTIMIKLEDVTGDGIDDITLYTTTDPLTSSGRKKVFAQVFAAQKDSSGNITYHKRGDNYEGYATVNGYDGSSRGTGSFNTGTWNTSSNTLFYEWMGDSIKDKMNKLK